MGTPNLGENLLKCSNIFKFLTNKAENLKKLCFLKLPPKKKGHKTEDDQKLGYQTYTS